MRLNDRRIEAIALAIVDRLAEEELIDLTMDEEDLTNLVGDCITNDLAREDEIHREAVEWLARNRRHLEAGTSDWEIELERRRVAVAIQRGYLLP